MRNHAFLAALAALTLAAPAIAQDSPPVSADTSAPVATAAPVKRSMVPAITIQHIRPQDKRGLNMFEAPKNDPVAYDGFKLDFGAAFTQQFQNLEHSNTADVVPAPGNNALMEIGSGFNNAVANLYVNAQLAPGIRVAMTSYLSSRHHQETWVKDGYIQIDESPIDVPVLHNIMDYVTLKVGHFEINYGDAHFRRTDNGNAMYNPFVGNLIMDAFTTEIGAEAYVRHGGFMVMGAVTGGEVRGMVTRPNDRAMSYIAKAGVDRQLTPDLRVRLMGSMYTTDKSASNTLFAGDRAGSRYYQVMENNAATENGNFRSGMYVPGFGSSVRAFQINPFVKFHGLEAFGVIETAKGRNATETTDRDVTQYAGDLVYRFLADEKLFVGARYNTVKGQPFGTLFTGDVTTTRQQYSAGWFVNELLMLKAEYVTQKYEDFPTADIRSGGRFKGMMVEGVVAF